MDRLTEKQYRILFIKPHGTHVSMRKQSLQTAVPLGILYLSSYLKKHLGKSIKTDIIDLQIQKESESALIARLVSFKPDMIGVSMLSYQRNFFKEYDSIFQDYAAGVKIVIGGPYPTQEYESALQDNRRIACAVISEGERVLLNLVNCFIKGTDYHQLKGIAYFENGTVICNEHEKYIEDLDSIGFPDYSLINLSDYQGYMGQLNFLLAHKRYTQIISSRACPYNCIFCHKIFGNKVRFRSAEHFVEEIKLLYHQYGVREFHIVDDIFNFDRKRMHKILNLIIESGMKIFFSFPSGLRGDLLTEEDINLMHKAGTYMIAFAIETASERMQKLIKKNLDINKALKNIEYASRIGMLTKGYFMIGFPSETVEEIKHTVSLSISSKLDMAAFIVVVPQYGTQLYEIAKNVCSSYTIRDTLDYSSGDSFYKQATGYNLKRMRIMAFIRFYGLKRLIILFFKVPWKGYFLIRTFAQAYLTLRV